MKEEKRIDYDRYRFSAKEKARYALTGTLLGVGIVWLVYHSPAALPLAGLYFFYRPFHSFLQFFR